MLSKIVRNSSKVYKENQRNLLFLQLVTLTFAEREGFYTTLPSSVTR